MNLAEELRDVGIEQTLDHDQDWKSFAMEQLRQWVQWKRANGTTEVTTEQFKCDLLAWFPQAEPHHPNCWGALTRTACLAGLIEATDRSVKMTLPASHSRYAKVWKIPTHPHQELAA